MTEDQTVRPDGSLNSMLDIRDYLMDPNHPFQPGEFAEFWKSLTDVEREEFKNTPLK